MRKSIYYIIISVVLLTSCAKEISKPSKGDADFRRIVAIGASVTAGASDYSMFKDGQLNSYPAIIAKQLKLVGMEGEFKLPLFQDNMGVGQGYDGGGYSTRFVIEYARDCKGNEILKDVPLGGYYNMTTDLQLLLSYFINIGSQGPFNDCAVPMAKCYDLVDKTYGSSDAITSIATGGSTNANPLFYRFCSDPGNASPLDDALKVNATFVIFGPDIAGNDMLVYAIDCNENSTSSMTSYDKFNECITKIVSELCKKGALGVIGTVPDVSSIAYFKRYFWNDLVLDNQQRVDALKAKYPGMSFHIGRNAFVIKDHNGVVRQAQPDDLIPMDLPMDRVKCEGYGAEEPLGDGHVFEKYGVDLVQQATARYNTRIKELAQQYNLALFDMNYYFNTWSKGVYIDGERFSSDFMTGNLFSLDGIHATLRGNAVLANKIIEAINAKYHSTIPPVDIFKYPTLVFPNRN